MGRGKDDEKDMGPMFPRLYVNDIEKGGPRAPPRNKMALYEQLSISSQKFNPSVIPLNTNNTSNDTLQASTSQGTGFKRKVLSPLHYPAPTPSHQTEKSFSCQFNGTKVSAPLERLDKRKRVEEDDFRVPVYVRSEASQLADETMKNTSIEKLASFGSKYSGPVEIQNDSCLYSRQTVSFYVNVGGNGESTNCQKDLKNENVVQPSVRKPGADQLLESSRSPTTRGHLNGCRREAASLSHEHSVSDISSMHDSDRRFQNKPKDGSQCGGAEHCAGFVDSTRAMNNGSIHIRISCFDSVENTTNPGKANGMEKHGTVGNPSYLSNLDKSDSVSKVSVVNAVSSMDISPDDVVGVIGQKHFWKARRAIANQQRVFAVQVFELHRLIKVQQLIAGSPELLLEDAIFIGKRSPKMSPSKKVPLEYAVKPRPQILKHNDNSKNPDIKKESSAENGVGKPFLSSVGNGDYPPSTGNAQQASMAADSKMVPWCFAPLPGHQWLIPAMSPSEGLVYKPCPGPEYSGGFCGGYGPYGPAGSFMNSAYVGPSPYQGTGVVPGAQPPAHPCFPHYYTPGFASTVSGTGIEQMNHVGGPRSFSQSNQLSAAGGSNSVKRQIPSDGPNHRNELLGSTASSPDEVVQGTAPREASQGRDALPLFSASTPVPDAGLHFQKTEPQTRAIKVVPHARRSASESAARIFQSIQEERKQVDSPFSALTMV